MSTMTTERVVAERRKSGTLLLDVGGGLGVVVRADGRRAPAMPLVSILARGYWEEAKPLREHAGPEPHPSGSPQSVHGGGSKYPKHNGDGAFGGKAKGLARLTENERGHISVAMPGRKQGREGSFTKAIATTGGYGMEKVIAGAVENVAGLARERGVIILPNGDILGTKEGGRAAVDVTNVLEWYDVRDATIVHNHPTSPAGAKGKLTAGGTLSGSDVRYAVTMGLHEIVAVDGDTVYRMRFDSHESRIGLRNAMNAIQNEGGAPMSGPIDSGEGQATLLLRNLDRLWRTLAEQVPGVTYEVVTRGK